MDEQYNVLAQQPGETPLQHHKRLVYGKLIDKTLSDYDYPEIAQYAYGKEYSSDVARRLFYGSCKTLELLDAESIDSITDIDVLSEIDQKMRSLQKERQKFFDQRREYNKLVTADGRAEHLYDLLAASAEHLNETIGPLFSAEQFGRLTFSDNEAVLILSDWHYGMTASNVFNEYNTEICKRRVQDIVLAAIERIQLHRCNHLHVVVLGDLLHGAIHSSARVASEELVCDQLMHVSEILAQVIAELNSFVEVTTVYMTYGNHARTVQNKKDNIHRDNMERIVPWWLQWRLKDEPGITIAPESDTEYLLLNVCGHDICAAHGDLDSVKSSPRLLATLFQKRYGRDIEYIVLGDKHHRESFDELGITSVICGSLCGTDDYANDKRLFSNPSQMLLIVNKEDGVDAEYHLKCK